MSLRKGEYILAGTVTKTEIREKLYPIGSVVLGNNLNDEDTVKSIYGGNSWQQITGALYGAGGQITTIGNVNEQLPKLSNNTTGSHLHKLANKMDGNNAPLNLGGWFSRSGAGEQYYHTGSGTNLESFSMFLSNWSTKNAGEHTHTISDSAGVQKDDGHVLAKGTSTYVWKRIS